MQFFQKWTLEFDTIRARLKQRERVNKFCKAVPIRIAFAHLQFMH
jgi:hypothetical protein